MCNIEIMEVRPRAKGAARRNGAKNSSHSFDQLYGFFSVALDPSGELLTTEQLVQVFRTHDNIAFFIGGPTGLPDGLAERCNMRLALSRLTFTSELARLLLVEQIYRVLTIMAGHPYHK